MVVCLGRGADLHMAQLMPRYSLSLAPVNPDWFYLPGSIFLILAHPVSPGQRLLNGCSSTLLDVGLQALQVFWYLHLSTTITGTQVNKNESRD